MFMIKFKRIFFVYLILSQILIYPPNCQAEENQYSLIIQNNRFVPNELVIPSGKKVKILIENLDSTPEEFESFDLNREKIISPKGKVVIFIGPLKPGKYKFFGEFHQDTAQGTVVVRDEKEDQ